MRLQGRALIDNQGKTNSEKKTGHLQDLCGSPDYKNGFSYNMNKLICETKNISDTDTKNDTSLTRVLTR